MERKKYIDILRALATIGVVIIHVACNNWYGYIGSSDWYAFTVYGGMTRVAVPIFFMISGALFLDDSKEITISYMMRHIRKLVIILVISAGGYQIANKQFDIKMIVDNILLTNTQSHLWFLYSIIGIYFVTPILKRLVKNISKEEYVYLLVLCLIVGSIIPTVNSFKYFPKLNNWITKLSQISCNGYVGYYLLGHFLDKYEITNKKKRMLLYMSGVVSCLVTVLGVMKDCTSSNSLNERFWGYCTPWLVFSSIALFELIKNSASAFNDNIYRALSLISKHSLNIYIVHFFVIMLLWNSGFSTFLFNGIFSVPVITLVVLGASIFCSMLFYQCKQILMKKE